MAENQIFRKKITEEEIQKIFGEFWHSANNNLFADAIAFLMQNYNWRESNKFRFPKSAMEQTQLYRLIWQKVLADSGMLFPLGATLSDKLLRAVYETKDREGWNNPFSALRMAPAAYFLPFLPLAEFANLNYLSSKEKKEKIKQENLTKATVRLWQDLLHFGIAGLFETQPPDFSAKITIDTQNLTAKIIPEASDLAIRINPYISTPLNIANGQTISAGYVVLTYGLSAYILTMEDKKVAKIFEAGVGSWRHLAYFAAMFSEAKLFGCDPFPAFCQMPENLKKLEREHGIDIDSRAQITPGDFVFGLDQTNFEQNAPYDLIYATFMLPADFDTATITSRLTPGGMFIAPLSGGENDDIGWLWLFYQETNGEVVKLKLTRCAFVPTLRGIQQQKNP